MLPLIIFTDICLTLTAPSLQLYSNITVSYKEHFRRKSHILESNSMAPVRNNG